MRWRFAGASSSSSASSLTASGRCSSASGTRRGGNSRISCLLFLLNHLGAVIAFADYDGNVRAVRRDGDDDRPLVALPGGEIRDLGSSPDGRLLVIVAAKKPAED